MYLLKLLEGVESVLVVPLGVEVGLEPDEPCQLVHAPVQSLELLLGTIPLNGKK